MAFGLGMLAATASVYAAAYADPMPRQIGACAETTIAAVQPVKRGRSLRVSYANGGSQITDSANAAIAHSRRGDRVRICLIDIPYECPPSARRGRTYSATNLRTGEGWQADGDEHCGD